MVVNPLRPLAAEPPGATPIRDAGILAIAGQALRTIAQRRLHTSLWQTRDEHPEAEVVLFEPYAGDGQLFNTPLMTYTLRFEVIRRGFRTTVKTLLADYRYHAATFARHGIPVVSRHELERRAQQWSREAIGATSADPTSLADVG